MAKGFNTASWARLFTREASRLARTSMRVGSRTTRQALTRAMAPERAPAGAGDWLLGIAAGAGGARRYRLFRPAGVRHGETLPLIVMLHGCNQDARSFAASTRMNVVAARERFLVLYPEQDRFFNAHGCWNWFETTSGKAYAEAALILAAIDQVCVLYRADRERVAAAGLSSGASMAALLVARYPERFKAVAMHSGIPPGTAHSGLTAVRAMHGRRGTKPLSAKTGANAGTWPPLMVIHGDRDAVVSADNGRAAVQAWAQAAGAVEGTGRSVRRGKRHPMIITDFKRRGTTTATLVEISRLGHAWSGGAENEHFSDAEGPDASRMIWGFSARQFAGA